MRVILFQNEIELAIEDFILRSVHVPDDIRIDIDLKATRGEEGYQAFIDLLPMSAPADGTDRTVDPRIEPKQETINEGLGIVDKINAAKQEAVAPRRRGRPAGVRNKPHEQAPEQEQAPQASAPEAPMEENHASEMIEETVLQNQEENQPDLTQDESEAALPGEIEKDQSTLDPAPEPTVTADPVEEDPNISATNEELISQAELNDPVELPEEPAQEEPAPELAPEQRDEFDEPLPDQSEIQDPVEDTGPAPTVTADDVTDQASEELTQSVSEPEPDTQPEPVQTQAEPRPTRSLFANLQRPS